MKMRTAFKILASVIIVLIVAFLLGLLITGGEPASRENIFNLEKPSFINTVSAAELDVIDTIVNEAGIAAYFDAATSVTLADVRDAFRTIEDETSDYIIGSVPVPDYPERNDVHLYVHKDGWFLAYYLAADPASKIFDWRDYSASGHTDLTTKFDTTLEVMAAEAAVVFAGATYYDFRYPNANTLMLIADWTSSDSDSFEVSLAGTFTYYERSWSIADTGWTCNYSVDGNQISNPVILYPFYHEWGTLTPSQLLPDQYHEISISNYAGVCYGGLVLVYQVP